MVSIRRISLVVSLLAISSIVAYLGWFTPPPPEGSYPLEKTVKYSITVKNPTNQLIKDSTFWLTAPLGVGVYQVLEELSITHPYRLEADASGNQRLHFTIDLLPPYGTKTFKVTAQLKLSPEPNTISDINYETFLGEEAFIEVNEPKIQQLAQQLAAEGDLDTVNNIYRWVTTNIKKTGYIKREKGALQTLLSETGDCTDTMYLFSALSRANGIPTRNMAGFTAMENAVLRPQDYHNWIEVFVGGKWQLVDPDKEVFMDRAEDYIAMTLLKDGSSKESRLSQRLFGGPENIKITMN
ncbi:MAG: transglutaminase domain-containing protein [Candidatus Thiodiazotropha lotti]|nr:transglutaminase domain-containing protein [Candidatus Thiodiazotropha lotti]